MDWVEIPVDVQTELSNPFFYGKTHGKKPTSQAGCRGPLCQKAERDAAKARYAKRKGGNVKQIKVRESSARDPLLTQIQVWHARMMEQERKAS
jgi:hypothetical protein